MNKCKCYRSATKILFWSPDEAPITINTGSCFGTKERDECHCKGDRMKCDFYPGVREKAKQEEALLNKATWIEAKSGFNVHCTDNYKCSNCGNKEKFATFFCSYCGKEMDSDKEIYWKQYK